MKMTVEKNNKPLSEETRTTIIFHCDYCKKEMIEGSKVTAGMVSVWSGEFEKTTHNEELTFVHNSVCHATPDSDVGVYKHFHTECFKTVLEEIKSKI